MIRNYLKIAWRNILNHKTFSILNILGLALSMSVCLLILLLYQDVYHYDKFHNDAERIYRVNTVALRKNGSIEPYASSPAAISKHLTENFTWIEKATALELVKLRKDDNPFESESGVIIHNNQRFGFDGKMADNGFFEIFNFKLSHGDAKNALSEPNSIVISTALSKKLFKNEDPISKTIEIANTGFYKITGVLQTFENKTHFQFDALFSRMAPGQETSHFTNYNTAYTYIKLRTNTDLNQAQASINKFFAPVLKNLPFDSEDAGLSFELQPLSDITPGYSIANGMGKGLPKHLMWFLTLMGFVVMISAIFNYANLTLANSLRRTKEMGVRKTLGAHRSQLLIQLMGEGIVLSFIAMAVSIGFLIYFKTELSKLQSFSFFDLNVIIRPIDIVYFVFFALIIGLIAGLLPAMAISKLNQVEAIRKIDNLRIFKRVGLGKFLLVSQYVFTMLFIMVVTTMHKQIEYAVNINFGFQTEQLYNVKLQGASVSEAKSKFYKIAGVSQISAMSVLLGTYDEASTLIKNSKTDSYNKVHCYSVDHETIPNLNLSLVAGENFSSNPSQNVVNPQIIINELFAEKFKLGDDQSAIGKTIYFNDSTMAIVKGVVKDFMFKPADYSIEPLMLKNIPSEWNVLNIKINSVNFGQTISDIKQAWNEIAPGIEFQGESYTTSIQKNYSILKDVNKVIQFFTLMGIVIGLLGLLGMTIISVEKRQKEISVRKILGASARDLVFILSKGFMGLLIIGFAIAVPLGLIMSGFILNNFANRIEPGLNIILPGFIILTVISAIVVGSQTIRAALMNPVKSLKVE